MPRVNLAWLVGIAGFFVFADVVASTAPRQNVLYREMDLIGEFRNRVKSDYYRELTPEQERELTYNMLNGGLEHLDPHSTYFSPKEWQQFNEQTKGEFGGIGVNIEPGTPNPGNLTVVSVLPGTPADDAGVLRGDVILKIDGKSTDDLKKSEEAVELIKGKEGEKVKLTVRHEDGKEDELEITRARIKIDNVLGDRRKPDKEEEWEYYVDKSHTIGYIRLLQFTEPSPGEMRKVVKQLQEEQVKALILDLRGNPGGLLEAACAISNIFMDQGTIVTVKGRNHKEEIYTADKGKALLVPAEKYPMVVLIDHGSASASEIVAAALQDNKRAVIIGERSYGKGSVQNLIPFEDRAARLKLTTALYWRPSLKNINRDAESEKTDEWGVMPDIEVLLKREERTEFHSYRRERDRVQGKNPPKGSQGAVSSEPDLEKDKALKKAIEHLQDVLAKAKG